MNESPRVVLSFTQEEVIVSVRKQVSENIVQTKEYVIDRGHFVATIKTLLALNEHEEDKAH